MPEGAHLDPVSAGAHPVEEKEAGLPKHDPANTRTSSHLRPAFGLRGDPVECLRQLLVE